MKQYLRVLVACMLSLQSVAQQYGTLKDIRDGKVYKTVKIGEQEWMAENLDVVSFRNGDSIPEARTNEEWIKAAKEGRPAWCYYGNDTANGIRYGRLYNWHAVNDARGLAPIGFHIPKDTEIDHLNSHISQRISYGPKSDDIFIISSIKLLSKKDWEPLLHEYNNSASSKHPSGTMFYDPLHLNIETKYFGCTGFEALPGGRRLLFRSEVTFIDFDLGGHGSSWWGITDYRSTKKDTRLCLPVVELDKITCVNEKETAINCQINASSSFLFINFQDKGTGSYVRCLRD